MTTQKEPSPEALANVTEGNIETRSQLLPEEKSLQGSGMEEVAAEVILAESEERTAHPDPDDAQGAHRQSAETADLP
jgi:type II secretory pathway component PulM